ncbi:MAG: glycyl-radical enzyme activating protein, partial [Candidatus Korarchaeum sp.]
MSSGIVFDIQRFAIHDGPGIRTNVFMKGCPLRCWWCQNPEGISPEPQVMYFEFKCIHCHLCCDACPRGAIGVTEGDLHVINRSLCDGCGICADNCPSGALKLVGKVYTVDQLMEEIKKDVPYYDSSGGGVTFTG